MGNLISSIFERIVGKKEVRLLMVGLDAAGKTSILYHMKLGEVVTTIPTIGFNVETIEYKNVNITVWDVGGQDKIRPLWRHYFQNTQGLIFVVDSSDHDRMCEAKEELMKLLQEDELRDAALLVYCNKQDVVGAYGADTVCEKLELHSLSNRNWRVQECSATQDSSDNTYKTKNPESTEKDIKDHLLTRPKMNEVHNGTNKPIPSLSSRTQQMPKPDDFVFVVVPETDILSQSSLPLSSPSLNTSMENNSFYELSGRGVRRDIAPNISQASSTDYINKANDMKKELKSDTVIVSALDISGGGMSISGIQDVSKNGNSSRYQDNVKNCQNLESDNIRDVNPKICGRGPLINSSNDSNGTQRLSKAILNNPFSTGSLPNTYHSMVDTIKRNVSQHDDNNTSEDTSNYYPLKMPAASYTPAIIDNNLVTNKGLKKKLYEYKDSQNKDNKLEERDFSSQNNISDSHINNKQDITIPLDSNLRNLSFNNGLLHDQLPEIDHNIFVNPNSSIFLAYPVIDVELIPIPNRSWFWIQCVPDSNNVVRDFTQAEWVGEIINEPWIQPIYENHYADIPLTSPYLLAKAFPGLGHSLSQCTASSRPGGGHSSWDQMREIDYIAKQLLLKHTDIPADPKGLADNEDNLDEMLRAQFAPTLLTTLGARAAYTSITEMATDLQEICAFCFIATKEEKPVAIAFFDWSCQKENELLSPSHSFSNQNNLLLSSQNTNDLNRTPHRDLNGIVKLREYFQQEVNLNKLVLIFAATVSEEYILGLIQYASSFTGYTDIIESHWSISAIEHIQSSRNLSTLRCAFVEQCLSFAEIDPLLSNFLSTAGTRLLAGYISDKADLCSIGNINLYLLCKGDINNFYNKKFSSAEELNHDFHNCSFTSSKESFLLFTLRLWLGSTGEYTFDLKFPSLHDYIPQIT